MDRTLDTISLAAHERLRREEYDSRLCTTACDAALCEFLLEKGKTTTLGMVHTEIYGCVRPGILRN